MIGGHLKSGRVVPRELTEEEKKLAEEEEPSAEELERIEREYKER